MSTQLYNSIINLLGQKVAIAGSFLNNTTSSKNGYLAQTSTTYSSKVTSNAVLTNVSSISRQVFSSSLKGNYIYVTGTFKGSGAKRLSRTHTSYYTTVTNSVTTSKSTELSRESQYTDYYYTQSQTNTETKTDNYTVATTRTTTSL
jgi:hypothetical protein